MVDGEQKLERAKQIQNLAGKLVAVVVEEAKNRDAGIAALLAAHRIFEGLPDSGSTER